MFFGIRFLQNLPHNAGKYYSTFLDTEFADMKLSLSQEKKALYECCTLTGLFLLGHYSQIQQGS